MLSVVSNMMTNKAMLVIHVTILATVNMINTKKT